MERSVVDTNSVMAGMFISATVFLTLTAQVVIYLRAIAAQDALWIKATCAQMVISSRMASLYLPSYENDAEAVTMISMQDLSYFAQWAVYIGTTSLTVFLVHILFTRRLYILGKCMRVQWNVGIPVGLITLTAQAFALLSVVQILRMERSNPQGLSLLMKLLIPAWLSLVVLADILIAGSLIILLYPTDHLIKRLIMFCVQTCLITTIAASVTIGVWVAAGFDTRHLFMSFPMGGLYAICLYANFLGRISYLNDKKFTEGTLESDSKVLETIEFSPGRDSLASTV
ncbi:hypothetical protein BJ138DRAFT_1143487 [Hygrophoropsis aurantiaca]|uniref:Uncharacterized protein n=1 Tax=Hygrophoropsis aurantiaca TaxID=72124 RepID=A0ACB8ANN4_9AGAM|nr:hypothetical protein BJ138DRAFT_1143487 [Hygrophoropsis aurantiaca]